MMINGQKKLFLLGLFLATAIHAPRSLPVYGSNPVVLRYSNNDLGTLANLNEFNVGRNSTSFNVSINSNQGVVMTTSTGQASSLFFKEQMAASAASPGFSTYFVMNVYKITASPADGYVFVLAQNSNSLGATGGGLGYQGIANSLGIEFDFYDNGGENVASTDVFQNGNISNTAGTVFDAGFVSRWGIIGSGGLVRAFHTWIEYDMNNQRLEIRVAPSNLENPSSSRPARPANATLTRTNLLLSQLSQNFFAGFTAATGGLAQRMALKSWYFSNAFISGGINVATQTYISDTNPPTVPSMIGSFNNNQHSFQVSGSTDAETSVAGYQYKIPSGSWTNYTGPVTMSTVGEYQARAFDGAGNFSLPSSLHLYEIRYQVENTIVQTIRRLSSDPSYPVDFIYEPANSNFRYSEWYLNSTFTESAVTAVAPRTTTITLFGKGTQYKFSLGYVLNQGTVSVANPTQHVIGEPILLTAPTREGYTFSGWFLDAGFTQLFNPDQVPQANLTLHAAWNLQAFPLTIVSGIEGDADQTIDVPFQTNLSQALQAYIPIREGHTFINWFTDASLLNGLSSSATMPSSALIVYGKWSINSYTIAFNSNGGTLVNPITQVFGTPLTAPISPTLSGHAFAGWYRDQALTNPYTFLETMPAEDVTLYAKWNLNTYQLIFDTQGGDAINPTSLTFGEAIPTLPEPEKEGHGFVDWFIDEALTQTMSLTTMPAEDVTLYAKWNILSFNLTLNNEGFSTIVSLEYGSMISLPVEPVRTGYTFAGWFYDAQFANPFQFPSVMPAQNIELFAKWDLNTYRIEFDVNGGAPINPLEVSFGDLIELPTTPLREGYTFLGWFEDASFQLPFSSTIMPDRNVVLFAQWRINSYTISYESNGGSSLASETVAFSSPLTQPESPSKEGFQFVGWFTDIELIEAFSFDLTMPARDIQLFAKWDAQSFQIQFDTLGGEAKASLSLPFQSPIALGDHPTKVGHAFSGWYLDEALTIPFTLTTMPAESLVLFARWTTLSYSVQVETNGGSPVSMPAVPFGQRIPAPAAPVKQGSTFAGWFLDAEFSEPLTEETTMPARPLRLHAKWQTNQYLMTFDVNEGSELNALSFDFEEVIMLPEDPTKVGHAFSGWYLDEALTIPFDLILMPDSDIQLYAKWERQAYTVTFTSTHIETPYVSETVLYGDAVGLPSAPVRPGYTFAGWVNDQGESLTSEFTMSAANQTLTARWIPLTSQVVFVFSEQALEKTFTSGESLGLMPTPPEKDGYVFIGWSTVAHDATMIITEDTLIANGETLMLYPIWERVDASETSASIATLFVASNEARPTYTIEIVTMSLIVIIMISGGVYYVLKERNYAHH